MFGGDGMVSQSNGSDRQVGKRVEEASDEKAESDGNEGTAAT